MKSNTIVLLKLTIASILLATAFSTSTEKSQTVMEFFNSIQTAEESGSSPAPTGSEPAPTDAKSSSATPTPEMLEDTLAIASFEFLKNKQYPPIILPDGTKVPIQTKDINFRVNSLFATGKSDAKTEFGFYFRMNGLHIYYAASKTDMNILGALDIKSVEETKYDKGTDPKFCFDINDVENRNWKLCAQDEKTRVKWVCRIRYYLKEVGNTLCEEIKNKKVPDITLEKIEIENKTLQPIILIPLASKKCNEDWNYITHGNEWECGCKEGSEQSPIDLPQTENATPSPVAPLFNYEKVSAVSTETTLDGQIANNQNVQLQYYANALRIFHPYFGKVVTLDGTVYNAEEIVFHTPAEHTIDGKRYDMEMQVIHYGQSKGDIAKQVVLSFLFEKKPGIYNQFLDDVDFFNLPNPIMRKRDIDNDLYIPKVLHSSDQEGLVSQMKPFSFYTYSGSLTFPPCSEKTIHYVASEPIPIASAPLALMKEALMAPNMINDKKDTIVYNDNEPVENYRETQPLNGRPVFFFNHKLYCSTPPADEMYKPKKEGHYEKYNKKATEFFYVNGESPSGLPGALLVDEKEARGIH